MRLQVLELDHVSEITQEVAAEVCREGLKGLEMLVLTATPVTPKALLHFNSEQWEFGGREQGVATAYPRTLLEHFVTLSELFLKTNSCPFLPERAPMMMLPPESNLVNVEFMTYLQSMSDGYLQSVVIAK